MKLKDIKAQLREKTIEELNDLILEAKKELFTLRMGHNKLKQLENTASIKNTKKLIARAKTVLRQKELQA